MPRFREPILSPGLMEQLHALRGLAYRALRKREETGRGLGQTPEFDSHRSYEPGDEPRYIDWNAFARFDRLLLKTYVTDEETSVGILVDGSRSMSGLHPAKRLWAVRLAAAFAYLALDTQHPVTLGAYADRLLGAAGPFRSLRQLNPCLQFLAGLPEGRGTDLAKGVGHFLSETREPSLLVVVSDFFEDGDLLRPLDELHLRRIRLQMMQVVDDAEVRPPPFGELLVSDVEGEEVFDVNLGADLREAWGQLVRGHVNGLAEACSRRGIPYLLARTSRPVEKLVVEFLLGVSNGAGVPLP